MIFEKLWEKQIPIENIISQMKDVLKEYDKEKQFILLSGNFNRLSTWTPIQMLLLDDPLKHLETMQFFIERGVDLSVSSKKGVDFYHLFLLCFFYRKDFQKIEYVDYFVKFFQYGSPQESVFYSKNRVLTLLDTLQMCQNNDILPFNFFPPSKKFSHEKLPVELYDHLYICFLCFHCQFFFTKPSYHLDCIDVENSVFYMKKYKIFKHYVEQKYKLPKYLSESEILKRIKILYRCSNTLKTFIDKTKTNFPIRNENYEKYDNPNIYFMNPSLIDTHLLRDYEFFDHSSDNTSFHKTYLPVLLHGRKHPYNRKALSEIDLQIWLKETDDFITFPTTGFDECFDSYPYIFNNHCISENKFLERKWFERLSLLFSVHHPYHQIMTMRYFPFYKVQYIYAKLNKEIKLFSKMKKRNLSILCLCKNLYVFCSSKERYVTLIHFLLEEILQDFKCYEKLQYYLDDIETNSFFVVDEYYHRFGTVNNSQYMCKFIDNLILLHKFNYPDISEPNKI